MLVAVTEGMPLECLAVMASGACVPESHKTATIRERVLSSLPHLRPWKAADIRPHSVEYLLILELQPVGYLEVHMSRGLQRCSQGTWTRRYNCSLPLPHDSSPRKEITHSSGASIFVIATQGTASDCLVWCPTGLTLAVPQDCTYFHTLFRVSFMLHTQRAIAS